MPQVQHEGCLQEWSIAQGLTIKSKGGSTSTEQCSIYTVHHAPVVDTRLKRTRLLAENQSLKKPAVAEYLRLEYHVRESESLDQAQHSRDLPVKDTSVLSQVTCASIEM